jgi:F-type H+-transporting ATPase subunit gamma
MQSISDIKRRIHSIQQTRQITKAMYLISTVKLRKALSRYEKNTKYIEKIRATMKDILLHAGEIEHPYLVSRPGERTAFIVIAGDKGLAGAYNHNVLNTALKLIEQTKEKYIFTVGHVATQFFNRKGHMVDIEFLHSAQDPQLFNARMIAESLVDLYQQKFIDKIVIIYTHVISTFTQQPRVLPLLPLNLGSFDDIESEIQYSGTMLYEPSPDAVFTTLVEQYLIGLVYATLVQSYASEQSARMRAMDSATDNAEEMIEDLNQEFRRARQAAITNEIIEIVSGANTVRNARGPSRS